MTGKQAIPFLVFPTGSAHFPWKIVSVETARTVSRHKDLDSAVMKAEVLNIKALFPKLATAKENNYGRR